MDLPFEEMGFGLGAALGGVSVPARPGSILIRLKSQRQVLRWNSGSKEGWVDIGRDVCQ